MVEGLSSAGCHRLAAGSTHLSPAPGTGQAVGGKAENGDVPAAQHFHFFFKEIPIPTASYPSRDPGSGAGRGGGGRWGEDKFLKQSRGAGQTDGHGRDEAEDGSGVG